MFFLWKIMEEWGELMRMDAHIHSNYSDGSDSVQEIMKKAKEKGLTHVSLVEHDTIESFPQAKRAAAAEHLTAVPGVELSAYDFTRNRKVHILGYGYKENPSFIQTLGKIVLGRRQRFSLRQIRQLQESGYAIQVKDVLKTAEKGGVIYKQHIMQQLTDAPYGSSAYKALYQELFKNKGICSGDILYPDAAESVRAIKKDGGYAVLAHPGLYDSYAILPELVQNGLDGIERNHPEHTLEERERIDGLAKRFGLFRTGGTDYHGCYGDPVGIGEWTAPDPFWESLIG